MEEKCNCWTQVPFDEMKTHTIYVVNEQGEECKYDNDICDHVFNNTEKDFLESLSMKFIRGKFKVHLKYYKNENYDEIFIFFGNIQVLRINAEPFRKLLSI